MKFKKSVLSIVLALVMLLTLLPVASAEGERILTIDVDDGYIETIALHPDSEVTSGINIVCTGNSPNCVFTVTIDSSVPTDAQVKLLCTADNFYTHNAIAFKDAYSGNIRIDEKEHTLSFTVDDIAVGNTTEIILCTKAIPRVLYLTDSYMLNGNVVQTTSDDDLTIPYTGTNPTWYDAPTTVTLAAAATLAPTLANGAEFFGYRSTGTLVNYSARETIDAFDFDLQLRAMFGLPHTLTYKTADGATIATETRHEGEAFTLRVTPEGYDCWFYTENNSTNFELSGAYFSSLTADITYTAGKLEDVTYVINATSVPITNESAMAAITLTKPNGSSYKTYERVTLPGSSSIPIPVNPKLQFASYTVDWEANNFYGPISTTATGPTIGGEHIITAHYLATLDLLPGTTETVDAMPSASWLVALAMPSFRMPTAVPTRRGYVFDGWLYSLDQQVYASGAQVAAPTYAQINADGVPTLTATWKLAHQYYPDYDTTDGATDGNANGYDGLIGGTTGGNGTTGEVTSPKTDDSAAAPLAAGLAVLALAALMVAQKRARA